MAFVGLNNDSMTKENAWLVMDTGRKIEMSLMLSSFIRATLVYKFDELSEYEIQERVLATNESLVTYKYRNRAPINLKSVLDLMLLDRKNPRSLIYQLSGLKHNVSLLPNRNNSYDIAQEEKLATEAHALLVLADTIKLSKQTKLYIRKDLDDLMSNLSTLVSEISMVITHKFFSHAFVQKI
jgi:uncharacterized alpha-E superfamily protein